jgi:hypothetical protein
VAQAGVAERILIVDRHVFPLPFMAFHSQAREASTALFQECENYPDVISKKYSKNMS